MSEVMLGEDDVLETKGRWRKMNKQLDKSHNHGLITDALAYSAYDTQSGTTMVWNEVRFRSTRTDPKQRRERQGSIDALNHRLAQLKKIKVGCRALSSSVPHLETPPPHCPCLPPSNHASLSCFAP